MVGLVWPKSPGVKFLVIVFCHWLMSLCKEVLIFKKLLKIKIIGTSWVLSTSSLCFAGEFWSLSALGTSFEVCWDRLRINAAGPITQRSLHAGQALASWCLSLCMCVAVCPSHKHMHTHAHRYCNAWLEYTKSWAHLQSPGNSLFLFYWFLSEYSCFTILY